ncbi:MAG: S9 family peptidase [Bacteroidales bacterium]|nr:S9 family peptidase [Bacteroidales bacterium]
MKILNVFFVAATLLLLSACCNNSEPQTESAPMIEKNQISIPEGRVTPEALWAFGRLSGASVSPDGEKILYSVSYYSVEQNRSNREWFVMNIDGSDVQQITKTPFSEHSAQWMKNGEKIAFLSADNGSMQIWTMNPDGSQRVALSNIEGGISDFMFSPDETKVLYIADVPYTGSTCEPYEDLPKATGIVVHDLMYKHWDEWVTTVPHPFVADFDGKILSNNFDILEGRQYECPMKPFNGIEDLAWSPDGKTIAYACKKKIGLEYAVSTNSDIYLYNLDTKKTFNLTQGMMGYDLMPQFSPDGTKIAWVSMERDGYESDKKRFFVADVNGDNKNYLTADFDYNTDFYQWKADGSGFWFIACKEAETDIWTVDMNKNIRKITEGTHDYEWVAATKTGLVGMRHSMSSPNELFAINAETGEETQISFENKHLLDQIEMGKVEKRWITTTDNQKMLTWVIYPPKFDSTKKYPAILYCEGGPQSTVSQFWSYRWNFQIMAANDYIIVAPNRRGLPGFGQEWLEQISGDYGGQNMKDYFSAIDALKTEPFIDENRLGCVGASYGGFSVYWIAGHHDKRFKAFIAHDGIFNLEQQYLETEEKWFANWDMGGNYWDKSNATAQRTFSNSPHKFVDQWDTPILCIHGEKDYRILASQGMAAFDAAVMQGIPAELLVFPDENHWVLSPQNGILWQRTFAGWLDRWLK